MSYEANQKRDPQVNNNDDMYTTSSVDNTNEFKLFRDNASLMGSQLYQHLTQKKLFLNKLALWQSQTFRMQNKQWLQLAGHQNSITGCTPTTICKLQAELSMEATFYKCLGNDPISKLTPRFIRDFRKDEKDYIEIEDLLRHFSDPCVLDVKMGIRTFLESETECFKERKDLYEKMIQVDPNEPNKEEAAKKSITKLRYMQFREKASSSATLGFRLEAIRSHGEHVSCVSKNCQTKEQVTGILMNTFLKKNRQVCQRFLNRLEEIEQKLMSSTIFKNHEMLGTSLLFMYDQNGKADVWMIDFAKVRPHPNLNHCTQWQKGNHEDGYLLGLRNLILIFERFSYGTAL